ncbi:MAG TPA: ABC transporter permease [Ktedonobacteraceae bacterium]|jgi:peptide/nickel transport system permease protein|nr:ABC transporter permease [Ktedonobacteraceae bacterium]
MRYFLRRIGFYLVALWAAITVSFVLPRLMPGNPALAYLAKMQGNHLNPTQYQALLKEFGVSTNVPIWTQYFNYLGALLRGQFGISSSIYPTPVATILAESIPWTIGLVGAAVTISFIIGTLGGMIIAWRRGSWYDTAVPPILTFLSAVPYFWMALAVVYIFGFSLGWFPPERGYDIFQFPTGPSWSFDFIGSVIQHAILPVFTLVIGSLAGWVLLMRNSMLTTLSEDYVLMAKAKGLPERQTMFNYAARNAILPSVTSFSISLGLVVSGSLLTEIVFNYPGIGFALYNAVQGDDYPLMEGCFLILALTVITANFLSELVYVFLDPRVRLGRN